MTSSSVINFYVMSKDQYDKMGVRCVIDISNALVRATNVDSYSLNWVVPSDGEYYFVFYNFAVAGERGAVTGSFTLQFPTSQLVTSTLQSTVSNEITFPTETIASTYSSTIMMPFQWVGNNLPYVIVGVIVIAGVLAGAVIMGTKRTSKPPKSKVKVAKREAKAKTDVQFCINCGAELPLKSEFCNKCGSAQK
jgi:ribosomal protein L40E